MASTISRALDRAQRALRRAGRDTDRLHAPGPIRGEPFGAERFAAHARELARSQVVRQMDQRKGQGPLLERLAETAAILEQARGTLSAAAARNADVGPAGLWLLDNYFVVEDHIRDIQSDLPGHYYRELPKLGSGILASYPRVYEIAIELVAHTEGRATQDNIHLFIGAFQEENSLSMGELWAIPSMLRLALLENVRRMALRAVQRLEEVDAAGQWARQLQEARAHSPAALGDALNALVSRHPPLTPTFVSHFLRQTRSYEADFTPLLWLEEWIAEDGLSAADAVAYDNQRVALTQMMMANSITSLRALTLVEWKVLFELHSVTEAVLRTDPSGDYAHMTFETRDSYRHIIEKLARGTQSDETAVAAAAIELASTEAESDRERHVGYWIFDDGREALEQRVCYRPSFRERLFRATLRRPGAVYFGSIFLCTALLVALAFAAVSPQTTAGALILLLFVALPANEIAVGVVNQLTTLVMPPRRLPRLDFRVSGIPIECRSAVAIPTLFSGVDSVHETVEHIEVQFLANRDPNLLFAILSDFTDADTETTEEDAAILEAADREVRALNATYAAGGPDIFFLLHRPRRWNATQGVWMGWERKRGKLAEFNRFLRDGALDPFMHVTGDVTTLRPLRYVLPLDSDTVLPREAAVVLIGTLAHPLNRAVYDAERQRVVKGYGILQPRIAVSLPSAHRSVFAAIHSGHPGVDPYTTAVSDVYQDLYAEGSYTGKGIYDVRAFQQATKGRFPQNTLLSHDLIEGTYARAALVADLELYDDYPTRYLTFSARKDRWIRGDWQLLAWLGRTVPGPDGPTRNRLSVLSQWKIFDNLRRSLIELSQVALLFVAWFLLPTASNVVVSGGPLAWTAIVLVAIAFPWLFSLVLALLRPPFGQSLRAYYFAVWRDAVSSAQQVALYITFLPHQAYVSARAIVRTLHRLFVSHRLLLEWRTASHVERTTASGAAMSWRLMSAAPLLALVAAAFVGARIAFPAPGSADSAPALALAGAALPVLAAWLLSPAVAHALSRPAIGGEVRLNAGERAHALRYAVLHWRYFSQFVSARTQWLAPDNFQEDPDPVVAARTSPTNIGLQLMSTVSAADLGFITRTDMLERLEQVFATLERMRTFKGHFYNWYDLEDLRVLDPAYVSTVDSGNLAGALLAVKQGCLAICDQPVRTSGVVTVVAMAERLAREPDGAHWHGWAATLEQSHAAETASFGITGSPEDILGNLTLRELARDVSAAADQVLRLEAVAARASLYVQEMDFGFLYDGTRKLFSIGYNAADGVLDDSFYDLLASEARLASFLAIARNDVPVEHWFRLGRTLTGSSGDPTLLSWSGSMFEYLMPLLLMRRFPSTLLDQTYHGAIRRHMTHGRERGVPWGVSESAYNLRDRSGTYQYRAFGVPGLGLKRGLGDHVVIAPYATLLSLLVEPRPAMQNLRALERAGALGAFGFRDALDFTRTTVDGEPAIVGAYMAHHIGMGLVALTNALHRQLWQRRFHADPLVRSVELLLHERIPRRLSLPDMPAEHVAETPRRKAERPEHREIRDPDSPQPRVALLGYAPYTVMVTNAGGGSSDFEDLAVTRWRADGTRDSYGQWCYVRDITANRTWSVTHQPVLAVPDYYRAEFAADRAVFVRVDGAVETRTDIVVVPEDSAEVRRVTLFNRSDVPREIEVTSYGEIVLAPASADRAHPAFSNLFVQTEWLERHSAILAVRRRRAATDVTPWLAHVIAVDGEHGPVTCETDRSAFIGRGRTTANPAALDADATLAGSTGGVLDPIFALRVRVRVPARASATVAFTTLVAATREDAVARADRYDDPGAAQRALELAATHARFELDEFGISSADATLYQQIAGHLLFPNAAVRASQQELQDNLLGQDALWGMGISGDWPVLLAVVDSADGIPSVRHLLRAHHYWRSKGMRVDLVILNTHAATYLQELSDSIMETVAGSSGSALLDRPGGVFIRRVDILSPDELRLLRATARVIVTCDGIVLGRLLDVSDSGMPAAAPPAAAVTGLAAALPAPASPLMPLTPSPPVAHSAPAADGPEAVRTPLLCENRFGGVNDRHEYEIRLGPTDQTPAPWSNIIANEAGGFCITERGSGFTWAENSYFFRLTPWHNDPVADPVTEAIYLRDEGTGVVWCPTPAPVTRGGEYIVRHGMGYSTFEHERDGIATTMTAAMAETDAVKITTLRMRNTDTRSRRIAVTSFIEWSLGVMREHTQHQVTTRFDQATGAMLAVNVFDPQFRHLTAFSSLSETVTSFTGDRREFLGRNGSTAEPDGMRAASLLGTTGNGFDPCAALQCVIDLEPGAEHEIVVLLGAATGGDRAEALIRKYGSPELARNETAAAAAAWRRRLEVISVRTPLPELDVMVNDWSLYQSLSCRMWGRSALYQSGGAYGFRDQLQDCMAFVHAEPALARAHILRAAARQFEEGDVQHWWHPQSGRGVRTRFSDDLAWLPFVVEQYVRVTGDHAILDEIVPFLRMRQLEPHEHEVYDLPAISDRTATLYDHCVLALDRACTTGMHGLPLIGVGDWNDGMNRVGAEGRGESVWLAWFLALTLESFAALSDARGDGVTALRFRDRRAGYLIAVDRDGWDGEWYRRAYFDDGSPLGSAGSEECRIDSIAQTWSVISGGAPPERATRAMQSLEAHLVDGDLRLMPLLTPPFDLTPRDPGYIKGYLPGVRENGAQYTHAALWVVLATAMTGDGDRAAGLLQMINPLTRTKSDADVARYRVEPYVVAADIYSMAQQAGRGGWTWYTGSASWFYRVALESILGFTRSGDSLAIDPCIPSTWDGFGIRYCYGRTTYSIEVRNPRGVCRGVRNVQLDGVTLADGRIPLVDDGAAHLVEIEIGSG